VQLLQSQGCAALATQHVGIFCWVGLLSVRYVLGGQSFWLGLRPGHIRFLVRVRDLFPLVRTPTGRLAWHLAIRSSGPLRESAV